MGAANGGPGSILPRTDDPAEKVIENLLGTTRCGRIIIFLVGLNASEIAAKNCGVTRGKEGPIRDVSRIASMLAGEDSSAL